MTISSAIEERVFNWLARHKRLSGQQLAEQLSVSRAAIWKAISRLRAAGMPIVSLRGHGYVLEQPVQLFGANVLQSASSVPCRVLFCTDSTNDEARALTQDGFVVAERQNRGRGRMGRHWVSVPGFSITLSGRFSLAQGIADLAGLNLAVAVAVWRCADTLGFAGLKLKWPNDLVLSNTAGSLLKVGGVLIEISGEMEGPCRVIVGLGLNWRLPETAMKVIDQPAANITDLAWHDTPARPTCPGRQEFLATLLPLIDGHVRNWCHPSESRRRAFRRTVIKQWHRGDALLGRNVLLFRSDDHRTPCHSGRYRGVLADGAMQLETREGLLPFHSGEVSLRPVKNVQKSPCVR